MIRKIYKAFCKFEEVLAMLLLGGLAALVFISALMRRSGLIGIDMLVKRFPKKVQKALDILFKIMILIFLCILVYYGIIMTKTGWKRQITALGISYGWVTMAVPTGAFFMIISTTIKLIERIKTPADQDIQKEAGRELA